jgi:uncharacterized membrane protein
MRRFKTIPLLITVIALLIAVAPFVVLSIWFDAIPDTIPAFVDLFGRPVRVMSTSIVSVFRLPLMGLLFLAVCLTMRSVHFDDEKLDRLNRYLWNGAIVFGALKMSITSLEVLVADASILSSMRAAVFAIVILAVITVLYSLFSMLKYDTDAVLAQARNCGNPKLVAVGTCLALYALLALYPLIGG